jgi:hypothetical protein
MEELRRRMQNIPFDGNEEEGAKRALPDFEDQNARINLNLKLSLLFQQLYV